MDHGWLKFKNGSFCVWKVLVFLKQSDEWFFSRTWFLLGVQGGWYQDEERPDANQDSHYFEMLVHLFLRCLWWRITIWPKMLNVQNGSKWHIEASMEKPPSPNLSFIELSRPHSSWFTFPYFTLQTTLLHVHPVKLAAGTLKWRFGEMIFLFLIGWFFRFNMNLQGYEKYSSYANGVEGGSVLLVVPHLPLGVVGSHWWRGV